MTDETPTPPRTANECARFEERLMAYLEHELDEATRDTMEQHRRECARCAGLVHDLETLAAQAAVLPSMSPARDLWSGIESRLETPVVPLFAAPTVRVHDDQGAVGEPRSPRLPVSTPVRRVVSLRLFAVAATMLIAVSSAVTWQVARTRATVADSVATVASGVNSAVDRPINSAANGPANTSVNGAVIPVANAGIVYEQEIDALRTIVNERFAELDSTTVAVLRRNLEIIDRAILDSRQALEQDPASRVLSTTLDRALESKLELMRRVALL